MGSGVDRKTLASEDGVRGKMVDTNVNGQGLIWGFIHFFEICIQIVLFHIYIIVYPGTF